MEGADGAGGAEGAGEASAPAQDSSGPTTTESMPIAPVYGGSMVAYNFSPALRTRKKEFLSEQFYQRQDYGTDYPSPYVPTPMSPRGGIDVERHMAGTGTPYSDPLDLFKSQGMDIDKKQEGVRRPSRPTDSSRQRQRGTSTYRKVNKENTDSGGQY